MSQARHAPVWNSLCRLPSGERIVIGLEHLDAQRVAVGLRIGSFAPQRNSQIAARAERDRHQQIDLGEQLHVVARARRTRLHEVPLVVGHQPRHLEQVDHVVHIELGETELRDCAGEVGMTVEVVRGAAQQLVDIWIATCAQQVVAAGVVGITAVPHGVGDECDHRPQERQVARQSVTGGDMGPVELSCASSPEPLAWIVLRPQVEIDDLRSVDSRESDDLPGRDRERVAGSHRNDDVTEPPTALLGRQPLDQLGVGCQRAVASSDVRGVRHLGSMSYVPCATTRTTT